MIVHTFMASATWCDNRPILMQKGEDLDDADANVASREKFNCGRRWKCDAASSTAVTPHHVHIQVEESPRQRGTERRAPKASHRRALVNVSFGSDYPYAGGCAIAADPFGFGSQNPIARTPST